MASFLQRIRVALIKSAPKRTEYLVKHNVFAQIGDNFYFQPRIIPINTKYIKFHNNVSVATNVTFCNHDIAQRVFNGMNSINKARKYYGCIEIMDNVFIGANSTILYNVRNGPNSIVAAGSVVTKDVPPGVIVGGVPAKVIGKFDDLYKKRLQESVFGEIDYTNPDSCWNYFYKTRE